MALTLDELYVELRHGRVYECSLRDAQWHIDGMQDGRNIYIDPRPAILETLLHELTHRRCPHWGERRVLRESRRLLLSMDEKTKRRWWAAYRRVKRTSVPVDTAD